MESSNVEQYCRALETVGGNLADTWNSLGLALVGGSKAVVNGKPFSRNECFVAALEIDPAYSNAWINLGEFLPQGSEVTVGEQTYSKVQCCVRSLEIDATRPTRWVKLGNALGRGDSVTVHLKECKIDYTKAQAYAKALESSGGATAGTWNSLGLALLGGGNVVVNEKTFTANECFVAALEIDPAYFYAWINLGEFLPQGSTVRVGEQTYTRVQCCKRGLELDPRHHTRWVKLGNALSRGESVTVHLKEYTQSDAYANALQSGGENVHETWRKLGASLPVGRTVLINGQPFTAPLCFRQALTLYQADPAVWIGLGRSLASWEGVALDGRSYNKIQCFEEALRLDPQNAEAWCQLGVLLCDSNQRSTAKQCAGMSGFQCLVQALSLNPLEAEYWVCVGNAFPPDRDSIVVPVDETAGEYSKRDCFVEAVRRNPQSAAAWAGLAGTEDTAKSALRCPDGNERTSIDCCVEALRLDKECSVAWSILHDRLEENEEVVVFPGEPPRGKQHCLSESLRCPSAISTAPSGSVFAPQGEEYKCLAIETASVHNQSVKSMKFDALLARGTYGEVRGVRGQENVVVKILDPPNFSTEELQHHTTILEDLRNHPGLVRTEKLLFDEGRNRLVTVMERMDGCLVDRVTRMPATLNLRECLRVCTNVLEALGYMHFIGITHGDIKPENILYRILPSGERQYKLADFDGAMKRFNNQSAPPTQGTLAYCSPERLNQHGAEDGSTACWDIWALGVTLYVLRYRDFPFYPHQSEFALNKSIRKGFTFPECCRQGLNSSTESPSPPSPGVFSPASPMEGELFESSDAFSEADFQSLVRQMLSIDVAARPSAKDLFALLPLERQDSNCVSDEEWPGLGEGETACGRESFEHSWGDSHMGEGYDSRVSTGDPGLSSDGFASDSKGSW